MKKTTNRSTKNTNVLKAELSVNLCNEIMQSRRVSIIVPDPVERIKYWVQENGDFLPDCGRHNYVDTSRPEFFRASVCMSYWEMRKHTVLEIEYSNWYEKGRPRTMLKFYFQGKTFKRSTRTGPSGEQDVTGDPLVLAFTEMVWRKFMMGKDELDENIKN